MIASSFFAGFFLCLAVPKNLDYEDQKIYIQRAPELSRNIVAEHYTIPANMFDNLCEYDEMEGRGLSLEELHMEENQQSSQADRI